MGDQPKAHACHPESIRQGWSKDLNVRYTTQCPAYFFFISLLRYFVFSTTPISSNAFKYSTTNSNAIGPYSADTASRISCAFLFPSAKFKTSYAYSSPPPHNPSYSNNFGFVVCPRFAHSTSK